MLLLLFSSSEAKLKSFQFLLFELNVIFISYLIPQIGIIKQNKNSAFVKYLSFVFIYIDNIISINNNTNIILLLILSMKLNN